MWLCIAATEWLLARVFQSSPEGTSLGEESNRYIPVPKGRPQASPGWSDVSAANAAQPWGTKTMNIQNPEGVARYNGFAMAENPANVVVGRAETYNRRGR